MTLPQHRGRIPTADPKVAYRLGAIAGIGSVLALDYVGEGGAFELNVEPGGLRDDWLAIGNDLRTVMKRTEGRIERGELHQGELFPAAVGRSSTRRAGPGG